MNRRHALLAALFIALAACGRQADPPNGELPVIVGEEMPDTTQAPNPAASLPPVAPEPAEANPVADPTSAAAARQTLLRYFELAAFGQEDDAAALWRDERAARAFADRLRALGKVRPNIADPGQIEGAAGSLYVSMSLQLLRGSNSGSDGTAVLRRVNDVPGSTEEQRRWRIDRIDLAPPPQPVAPR